MAHAIAPRKQSLVWDMTAGRCWYCGIQTVPATLENIGKSPLRSSLFSVDHALPRQRGGTNDLLNLLPACLLCNQTKNTKTLEEFRLYMTRLLHDIPLFTTAHVAYLKQLKIPIPDDFPCYPKHVFWGEESLHQEGDSDGSLS